MKKRMKMKFYNIYLLIGVMLFVACSTLAQPQDDGMTSNKKAEREYQNAKGLTTSRRYSDALKPVNKAIFLDENFVAAYDLKSRILYSLKRNDEMIENYRTMLKVIPAVTREVKETYYILATLEKELEMYDSAATHFKKFIGFDKVTLKSQAMAKTELESCRFAANAIRNPIDFKPVNMGPGVNTELNEYHIDIPRYQKFCTI
jgi:tetratricopeptide (TPR) repeat protein